MKRRPGFHGGFFTSVGVVLFLISATFLGAGEGSKKSAIPSAADQAKALALIKELYAKEYNQPAKEKASLAAVLLQEGRDTNDYPAGRFMLFREARDLAAKAGDAPTALQAIDELAQSFAISEAKVLSMKIQALNTAGKAVAGPDAYHTVVDNALVLAQEALAADDYDSALELMATADNAAKKLKFVSLVSSIRKRQQEVLAGQKEYARWKPFADALRDNPGDPKANLEMGKYQALIKGNWDKGLPLLAKGNHLSLSQAAALDIAAPKPPGQQMDLGLRWWKIAGKAKGKMRVNLLLRSYHWYVLSLAGLEGEKRKAAEKQMALITQQLPAEYRPGEIVEEIRKIEVGRGPIYTAAFTLDGRKVLAGGADSAVTLWDLATGRESRRLEGHTGRVWTVAVSPDGRRAVSGGFDNSLRLWNLAVGRELRRFPGHADYVRSAVFSHGGRCILSGGDDRLLRLWNTDTGSEIRSFTGHEHFVWSVDLSPDGKYALSGSLDKTVRLWDVASGKELKKLIGHRDTVLSVAFSPDSRHALSGSTDRTLKLWDLVTGKPVHSYIGHAGYVNRVAFSPDGRRALSAGQDGLLILWDVYSGKELRRFEGHRGPVWCVAFSRDGRLAVSAGDDGSLRIWGGRQQAQVRRP